MHFSPLLAVATLATSVHGLYFSIWPIAAYDAWYPSEHHNITFTVSDPQAAYEQGGSKPAECNIGWDGCDPPTCWKRCAGDNGYYARIAAGSYNGAADFSLDIWQEYVYELANHNNATVHIEEGMSDYNCVRGEGEIDCSTYSAERFNQTLTAYYGGATPTGGPICQ